MNARAIRAKNISIKTNLQIHKWGEVKNTQTPRTNATTEVLQHGISMHLHLCLKWPLVIQYHFQINVFIKFLLIQQLTKLSHFSRESGDKVVAYIGYCLVHL